MKKFRLVFIVLTIISFVYPVILFAQQGSMDWTQATANAGWSARNAHTSVVFDNKMWVMGGHDGSFKRDVWYSTDGVNWTQATANAGWIARSRHTSVVFDNKMWVMGGSDGGSGKNDVWYSTDGVNWTQATGSAGWSARYGHTSVVFDNKICLMGGWDGSRRNDVWYSSDGVNWTQATANAGWSARYRHTSVVFDNKIWVMGGYYSSGSPFYRNDVWYSTGLRTITLVSPNGGEIWFGGSTHSISWRVSGSGFARYRLLLSTNSGSTYPDTIAHNVAISESTYQWFVPTINWSTCRVMIQVLNTSDSVIVQDASDGNFTIMTTAVEEHDRNDLPYITTLYTIPMSLNRDMVRISFCLAERQWISLKIYNVSGEFIKTLANAQLEKGIYTYNWDRKDEYCQAVAKGIYFYRLEAGNFTATKKMVILR